jgi:hypothetical protein
MVKPIEIACAWCATDEQRAAWAPGLSHGICPACYQSQIAAIATRRGAIEIDVETMANVRCPDCTGGGFLIGDSLIPVPCGTCAKATGFGSGKVLYPASLLKLEARAAA